MSIKIKSPPNPLYIYHDVAQNITVVGGDQYIYISLLKLIRFVRQPTTGYLSFR